MKKFSILFPSVSLAYLRLLSFLFIFISTSSFAGNDPETPVKSRKAIDNYRHFAGGDFSLDFVAAGPYTYNHLDDAVSSGGQYGSRLISKTDGVVESLEGGDFKCGDWVIFLTAVTVDANATGSQTIELDYSFLANSTGQSGAALCAFGNVTVNTGDPAMAGKSSGNETATLNPGAGIDGTIFTAGARLKGTVTISGLEAGEVVIVRVPVKICCDPGSHPTGNLQGAILAGRVKAPGTGTINVGNQTVPFKKIGELQTVECSITPRDAVCSGTTNTYTATSTQAGSTFEWTITGNGTFVGGGTTFTETPAGTTSSVDVVAGAAGSYTLGITISKSGFATTTCSQEITVNATPEPLSVKNLEFCLTPGAVAQLLDAIVSGTPIFTDANGTPLDPQPTTQSLGTLGTFVFYAIQESLGGCKSEPATFSIKVNPNPDAPGVKNTEFCADATGSTLLSNNITSGTAIFTDANGTPLDPQPTTQSLATAGTFTFYVIQKTGDCKSPVVSFTIKVNPNPDAPGVNNTEVCVTSDGSVALAGNITSGTAIFTDANGTPLDPQPTTQSTTAVGVFTYYVIQKVGDCKSPVASFTITVKNCYEGCTPGYWKNRKATWNTIVTTNDLLNCVNAAAGTSLTGELKNALFQTVFGLTSGQMNLLDGAKNPGSLTLLGALSLGDGSGFTQLARAATAALLNACSGMKYPYTSSQIITEVKAVFASGSRTDALALATKYDVANNAGCTLSNGGKPAVVTVSLRPGTLDNAISKLDVKASPNPYNDQIRFTIQAPKAGRATLEVYNMLGQKVGIPFEGQLRAGETRNVEYTVPVNYRSSLIYMLRMNGEQISGKLMSTRQ